MGVGEGVRVGDGEGTGVKVLVASGVGGRFAVGAASGIAGADDRLPHPTIKTAITRAAAMAARLREDMKSGSDDLNLPATFIDPKNIIWQAVVVAGRARTATVELIWMPVPLSANRVITCNDIGGIPPFSPVFKHRSRTDREGRVSRNGPEAELAMSARASASN